MKKITYKKLADAIALFKEHGIPEDELKELVENEIEQLNKEAVQTINKIGEKP